MKKNKNKKTWSILLAITMIFTQGSTFAMAEEGADAVAISENSAAESAQVFTDEDNAAAVTSEDLDADNVQTGDTAGSIDESEVEAQEELPESGTSELTEDEIQILPESEAIGTSEEAEQILGDVEEQTDTEDWAAMLISEDNEESESTHVHCVCGKANATEETHTHAPETTWQPLSGTISGILESGNYYLSENVTVASGALIVEDTVNLCLNGYALNAAEGSAVFTVEYGGSLSVTDCQGSGTITGGSDSGIVNKGTFTFWNGSISNNTAYEGGGIYNCGVGGEGVSSYLPYNSTVIMYGGSITGNIADAGGGVFNDCGTVILYGGSIANNKAEDGGGVYNHCTFSDLGGKFEMLGGTITSNSASYQGGGVSNFFTFTMSGGSITNNTVYRAEGLTASANSGGVLNGGTFTVSGTVVITGNDLGGKTDNVCLYNYCEGDAGYKYQIVPNIIAQNLTENARIGVNAFTPVSNLTIVTGSVNTAVFTCDDNHYTLENNEANGLKLVSAHTPSWGNWIPNGDGTHTRTCTECGQTETVKCSGGTADCHTKAICTVCGGTYGEFDSANHTGGTEVRGEKKATCTQEGYTGDTYCLGCKEKITSGTTIPMKAHTWDDGTETTKPTCIKKGVRTYTCIVCKKTKTEEIPLDSATGHQYGSWITTSKATVFSPAIETRTCSECKNKETRKTGKKLTPTIQVNATTVLLKVKQKTSAFKVTGLANGDSVTSYKSSNTKIFTVDSKKGIITAGKKTGSAKLTITLKSGTKKTVTVKVQKTVVKTTKITGLQTKVTMKKGAKLTLKPSRTPITSTQNFTYKTSNKKVATVSSKGVITAKKKGTVKITVKSGNVTKIVTVIVK